MVIVKILSKKDKKPVNYLMVCKNHDNFKLGHRLRIKQIIYSEIFTYYHPEMNFDNYELLIDNRNQIK